jgi:hypothetical protein
MNKWAVLDATYRDPVKNEDRKVFDPHAGQLQFMEDPARFLVIDAGRRLGKSRAIGHEFIPEAAITRKMASWLASEGKRREFWTVGPNYSDSEKPFRVFWDACKRLGMPFDKPGSYYSLEGGDMTVSLWDGAFIYSAKSAAVPERLVGEGLSGVHIEEAAKMKEIVWTQMLQPTLSDFDGWAKFTSTPEGKNWFYRLYMNSIRDEKLNWNGHRLPAWRNPYVYKTPTVDAHVKRMMQIMSDHPELSSFEIIQMENLTVDPQIAQLANDQTIPTFQQEVAAEFTDFVGKVFKEFDEETHTRFLPFNPNWETIAAVDYGYRNPNVWLLIQVGPWGEINIIDELYQENLAPDEFAQEVLRRGLCPDIATEFYPDPALPGDTKTLENIFRRAGKRIRARPHTGGELQNRLNLIRLALKDRVTDNEINKPQWTTGEPHDPRPRDVMRPRMMVSTKCPKTIYELSEYRYPEKKSEEAEISTKRYELPMKKDDHTPEAIGRFLAGKYHDASSQYGSGTRISHARFLRSMRGRSQDWSGGYGGYGDEPAGIPAASNPRRYGPWK